jgi:single-strand DNA-binding protein
MQTRQWQDQEGQTRYRTEVIASDMIMLDGRGPRESMPDDEYDHRSPARGAAPSRPIDIGDEDIPF